MADSFFHHSVALARCGLQASPVNYLDFAALVGDEPRLLEFSGDGRDARARHAQHVREKLLRQMKRI